MTSYLVIYEASGTLMSSAECGTSEYDAAEKVVRQYGASSVILVSKNDAADRSRRVPLATMEGKS